MKILIMKSCFERIYIHNRLLKFFRVSCSNLRMIWTTSRRFFGNFFGVSMIHFINRRVIIRRVISLWIIISSDVRLIILLSLNIRRLSNLILWVLMSWLCWTCNAITRFLLNRFWKSTIMLILAIRGLIIVEFFVLFTWGKILFRLTFFNLFYFYCIDWYKWIWWIIISCIHIIICRKIYFFFIIILLVRRIIVIWIVRVIDII